MNYPEPQSRTITADTPTNVAANRISLVGRLGGSWYTASTVTQITWYGALAEDGTPMPLYDENNDPLVWTVAANRIYPLPVNESYGCQFLFAKGDAAGTIVVSAK